MNMEILLCLITHQLQCYTGSLLLSFLFAFAAAFADYVIVYFNLNNEVLVMVGT